MALPRTAGRKGHRTRKLFAAIRAESDICCYCGHPGAHDVNHNQPLSTHRHLALTRTNLAVIHGATNPCPHCPPRWSRRHQALIPTNCNSIVGARPLDVALAQRNDSSRNW